MATDWAGFWYDEGAQEAYFKPPCVHDPLDIGFSARTVWCRKCDRYLKFEEGEWVIK